MSKVPKYKSRSVKIVPWETIEQRYIDLISHSWCVEPVLALVQFIRNNGYNERLFGYTSLDRLIITIYSPAEWQRESLTIAFGRTTENGILNITQNHSNQLK